MPTTSNFGWTTPADTDLVKDGAAAIRTLGNGIDTSLVDLKGGTTGQVLSKNSNTDLDFTWVAQDDSNAIQNALLTTTGDTIYASGASTPARLGIGTTGQVLTVAGGVPTWATPASSVPTLNEQIFTSSGTFTPATGVTKVWVEIIGGGGGGGRDSSRGGGGGGAGGTVNQQFTVTPGVGVTVTVGAGGAARTTDANGNNGSSSGFSTTDAYGGAGGRRMTQTTLAGNISLGGSAYGPGEVEANSANANTGAGGAGNTGAGDSSGAGGSGRVTVRWLS